jgi:DNA-binding response OmpR family regulator
VAPKVGSRPHRRIGPRRRSHLFCDQWPIIAQSGWGQERHKMLASEAGFDRHLVKPVALEDLERLLAAIATPA